MLLIGFLLRADDDCIDIGANRGRFLSAICTRLPSPPTRAGPSSSSRSTTSADSGLRGRNYPGEFRTERIEVAVERLDDALPEGYAPTLIKVDVEGAERGVFEGGLETIARHEPVIVFEHGLGGSDRYGTTSDHVFDLLVDQAGLRLFDLDADGPLSRDQLAQLFASGTRWNFLARP